MEEWIQVKSNDFQFAYISYLYYLVYLFANKFFLMNTMLPTVKLLLLLGLFATIHTYLLLLEVVWPKHNLSFASGWPLRPFFFSKTTMFWFKSSPRQYIIQPLYSKMATATSVVAISIILLIFPISIIGFDQDGGWSPWSKIETPCQISPIDTSPVLCNGGVRIRYRSCTMPVPQVIFTKNNPWKHTNSWICVISRNFLHV